MTNSNMARILPMMVLLLVSQFSSAEKWLDSFDAAQYKGKVVYVDFWASWCGPCRKSFPWLNNIEKKYKDKGLVVIGINLDSDFEMAKRFLEKTPAYFQLFSDPKGVLAEKYKLIGMPSSFVLDRNGEVRHRHVGFKKSNIEAYETSIVSLLNETQTGAK